MTAEQNKGLLSNRYGNCLVTCSHQEYGADMKMEGTAEAAGRCMADKSPYFTFNTPADNY
jgi:hypothetical protein